MLSEQSDDDSDITVTAYSDDQNSYADDEGPGAYKYAQVTSKKKYNQSPAKKSPAKASAKDQAAKKRKLGTRSPEPTPIATRNSFAVLTVDPDATNVTPDVPVKKYKIPPLMMAPLKSHKELMDFVKQSAKSPFTATPSGGLMKVCLTTIEDYHDVTVMINELKMKYHTWSVNPARARRVIIRGLPSNTLPEDILQELKDQGFNPSAVVQLSETDRETKVKRNFPLFAATFRANFGEAFAELSSLKVLLHCRVTTEAPREKSGPIQCHRCQRVGHKEEFCKQLARCVCCGEQHESVTCKLPKDVKGVCCNCGGRHSANWGGCPYLKARKGLVAPRQTMTTTNTLAAPRTTATASTSGQRDSPRLRLEMPSTSEPSGSWVQPSDRRQKKSGESFPALPGTSVNAAPQAAPRSGLYSAAATNRLATPRTTTPETRTTSTPIIPTTSTATVTPPAQQETPTEDAFNWKDLIVKLAQFVAELNIHPTVTMLARLVPSLLGGAVNNSYSR